MGANQSSQGAGASAPAAETKTSYYELLGVERAATDDEIKKAYRRKALELHPDRNYGKEEEATRVFAEIQAAYEVLSDPQERAWYDSHESQILRGDDDGEEAHFEHNMRMTTADEIFSMMRSFNSRIDFSDSPSGFYGFLRETFEKLAKEEQAAADWEGLDVVFYPSFGHKDDSYEDVVKPFYAVWTGFSTKKSFAWKDKHRYSDAPDRRYRRAMEKENQRLRDEGKREFNDAVKTLVAFVRKRDPRYSPNAVSDAERLKALRDAAAAQAARQRAENEAKMKEHVLPEWAQAQEAQEVDEFDDEEEEEEEHYECVACHKTFKSEKQYDAHEKSKKHQKAVYALKKKMQKENRHLNLDDEATSGTATPASEEDHDAKSVQDGFSDASDKDQVSDKLGDLSVDADEARPVSQEDQNAGREEKDLKVQSDGDEDEDEDEDDDLEGPVKSPPVDGIGIVADEPEVEEKKAPKMGKAAQKRAKRAAQAAAAEQSDSKFKCAVCNAGFPSKTRMFQHISDFGHAAPVQQKAAKAGKGKRK